MLIRQLLATDIPLLAQLMAATPLWQRYGVTVPSATARLQSGLSQSATIFVAELDQRVVGFVWYVLRGTFQRGGYIMLIAVQPDLRGQGVGEALMRYAEKQMFSEVDSITLLVSDFNHAAQRFYQRLGYSPAGSLPDFVIPGVCELIFYKHK